MFRDAYAFNQPLNSWQVSAVENMLGSEFVRSVDSFSIVAPHLNLLLAVKTPLPGAGRVEESKSRLNFKSSRLTKASKSKAVLPAHLRLFSVVSSSISLPRSTHSRWFILVAHSCSLFSLISHYTFYT